MTAALATHLVGVLARDGRRLAEAQRDAAGGRPAAAARRAARRHGGRARPRHRRRGDARGPRLRERRARGARSRSRGRATTSRSSRRRVALAALAIACGVGGWEGFEAYPRLVVPLEPRQLLRRRRAADLRAAAVRRPPGDRVTALALSGVTYSYPDAERAGAARRDADRRAGRVRRARRRLGLRASRRCCAPPPASCRTSTAARSPGRLRVRRARHARARAGRAGRGRRDAVPGPGDAGRDGHRALRARVPAREPRLGRRRRSRAGWRRRRSRSGSRRCSTARRASCPAASSSASRSAPRSPAARGVLLLDEPTSQLDPVAGDELLGVLRRINEEWGTAVIVAEHRLERCLPAADRVLALRDGALAFDGDARRVRRLGAARAPAAGHAPVRARRRPRPPGHRQGRAPRPGATLARKGV